MPVPPLESLPPARPRRFLPAACACGDWAQVEPLFLKLEAEAPALRTPKALAAWILTASELAAGLAEEEARRYIRMTCQTDDAAADRAWLHFIEELEPRAKPHWQRLRELYLACPHRRRLPKRRWRIHDRETHNEAELFRAENVALQTAEAKLEQQYQKLAGVMTVTFRGQELTLQQMGRFLEEPARDGREEAWRLVCARRLKDRDPLEQCFDDLRDLRAQIARNAGFASYRDFAFRARSRFDYTPEDCVAFHQAVEESVVPLARKLQARRARLLGVAPLRPWDLAADPRGRPALKPFTAVDTLLDRTQEVFRRIDPAFGRDFGALRGRGLLDLESRKGKAPGGYQYTLEEARLPFIFMNAAGLQRDVETLLHEGGHAFHSLAVRDEPLLLYRHAPLEFCEVASMSMELLAHPHYDVFYAAPEAARARRMHLETIVQLLPWVATVDAFQHWIYEHEGHTREERRAAWVGLLERFGGIEDWSGCEEARDWLWHRQPHLFTAPFYYIEYGIAQLGALQVWQKAQKNLARTVTLFRRALAMGRSRPLPELFHAAGLRFDLSARGLRPLVEAVARELAALEEA